MENLVGEMLVKDESMLREEMDVMTRNGKMVECDVGCEASKGSGKRSEQVGERWGDGEEMRAEKEETDEDWRMRGAEAE